MAEDDVFGRALAAGRIRKDGGKLRMVRQPTDDMVQCPKCGGQGVIKQWQGDRTPARDCPYCEGIGGVTEDRFHAFHDLRKG